MRLRGCACVRCIRRRGGQQAAHQGRIRNVAAPLPRTGPWCSWCPPADPPRPPTLMKELRIVTQRLRTARQKRGPERWISQCDSQRLSLHCKDHRRHTGVVLRTCIGSTSCFAASASTAPSTASSADEGGGGALDGGDGLGGRIEEVGGGEDSAAAAVALALRFSATKVSESNMSCTAACASLTAVLMRASSSRQ